MEVEEAWISANDVATYLNVTKDSIYRWIRSNGLPAHKVGRLLRFRISEVDDWVRQGNTNPSNKADDGQ